VRESPAVTKPPSKGSPAPGKGTIKAPARTAAGGKRPVVSPAVAKAVAKPTIGRGNPASRTIPPSKPSGGGTSSVKAPLMTSTPRAKQVVSNNTPSSSSSHHKSHQNASNTPSKSNSKEKATIKSVKSKEKTVVSKIQPSNEKKTVETKTEPLQTSKVLPNAEINPVQYQARLGLARVLVASNKDDNSGEVETLYKEVIQMAPQIHSAYIELGELLASSQPMAAVEVYCQFTSSSRDSYDDAYIYGEIVRLLMKQEQYQDTRLIENMISLGKVLGFSSLEKYVAILEKDFKNNKLLREVYAGVNGKPVDDPDLQTFFKFKCWK